MSAPVLTHSSHGHMTTLKSSVVDLPSGLKQLPQSPVEQLSVVSLYTSWKRRAMYSTLPCEQLINNTAKGMTPQPISLACI